MARCWARSAPNNCWDASRKASAMTIEELRKIAETEREAEKKFQHRMCVCTAAGCLSSGTDHVLDAIRKEVVETGMKNEVLVKGVGCMGLCSAGPLVSVESDGKMFANVTPEEAPDVVSSLDTGAGGPQECPTNVPFFERQKKIVLENCGKIDPERIEDYIAHDGYLALVHTIAERSPQETIQEIIRSGLRGRLGQFLALIEIVCNYTGRLILGRAKTLRPCLERLARKKGVDTVQGLIAVVSSAAVYRW